MLLVDQKGLFVSLLLFLWNGYKITKVFFDVNVFNAMDSWK